MSAGNATVGSRPDPSAAGGGAARRAFRLSFAGLLTTMAVASLDQNIVSTALPRIVGELGGLAHLPWVITAFMLTATATAPLYGKLSDMHGRRPALARRDEIGNRRLRQHHQAASAKALQSAEQY